MLESLQRPVLGKMLQGKSCRGEGVISLDMAQP